MRTVVTVAAAGAALTALAVPAVAANAAPAAKADFQSVSASEVARQQTVDGITYKAVANQSFRVKFTQGDVKFAGRHKANLVLSASPSAQKNLTVVSVKTGNLKVSKSTEKVVVKAKKGKKVKKSSLDAVTVTTRYTGIVKTKFGNFYKQTGTLATTVLENGSTSSVVDLGPEVKLGKSL